MDVGEDFVVVTDDGGRYSGAQEVVTAASWAELLQYDAGKSDDHECTWWRGTESEIRDNVARTARSQRANEHAALAYAMHQHEREEELFASDQSSEPESQASDHSSDDAPFSTKRRRLKLKPSASETVQGTPASGEDYNASIALLQETGTVLSNAIYRKRSGHYIAPEQSGGRVRHSLSHKAFHNASSHAPSQFISLLCVKAEDAGRLCLEEDDDTLTIRVNDAVDDAPALADVYSGPHISSINAAEEVHAKGRALLWTALGSIVARQNSNLDFSTNIRLRLRLGSKVIRSHSRLAHNLRRSCISHNGVDTQTSDTVCEVINRHGTQDTQFNDFIEKPEFDRIEHSLLSLQNTLLKHVRSEAFQFHVFFGRERFRVTCVQPQDSLVVTKVKNNSNKYVSVDVLHPHGHDYRYDVRTTDNVPQQSETFEHLASVLGCFGYEASGLTMLKTPPFSSERIGFSTLRYKRKQQFHVPGCGLGASEGATKVSLSRTLQIGFRVRDVSMLSLGFVTFDTCNERHEVGAQLLSTKALFDRFKRGQVELSSNISATVMNDCRHLFPHALAALSQISVMEATRIDTLQRQTQAPITVSAQNREEMEDDSDEV